MKSALFLLLATLTVNSAMASVTSYQCDIRDMISGQFPTGGAYLVSVDDSTQTASVYQYVLIPGQPSPQLVYTLKIPAEDQGQPGRMNPTRYAASPTTGLTVAFYNKTGGAHALSDASALVINYLWNGVGPATVSRAYLCQTSSMQISPTGQK